MESTTQGAASGGGAKRPVKKVRASILVTRWWTGRDGKTDGESTERVSIPVSRIKLVEPYTQEIWISLAANEHGPGSVRARIFLTDDDYVAVTETVEEVDRLMNVPLGGEAD